MKDKISVILPTRNRNDRISRSILSIFGQCNSSFDIEVIIVDDNDIDQTENIKHCMLDDIGMDLNTSTFRIKIVRNIGKHSAANARNYGVLESSGSYITFLDDDDAFLPNRLNEMFHVMKKNRYDFLSTYRVYEHNNQESLAIPKWQLKGDIRLEQIALNNDIDIGIFLSKELFVSIGMFDCEMKSLEDWELILRLLSSGKNGYKIDKYLYLVNNDRDIVRVTDNEIKSYGYIAEKYKSILGAGWFYKINSRYSTLSKKYSLLKALSYTYKSKSLYPCKMYIKFIIEKLRRVE